MCGYKGWENTRPLPACIYQQISLQSQHWLFYYWRKRIKLKSTFLCTVLIMLLLLQVFQNIILFQCTYLFWFIYFDCKQTNSWLLANMWGTVLCFTKKSKLALPYMPCIIKTNSNNKNIHYSSFGLFWLFLHDMDNLSLAVHMFYNVEVSCPCLGWFWSSFVLQPLFSSHESQVYAVSSLKKKKNKKSIIQSTNWNNYFLVNGLITKRPLSY